MRNNFKIQILSSLLRISLRISLCVCVMFVLSLSLLSSTSITSKAQAQISSAFEVPDELAPRVGFWIGVFAKYGKNHKVFHDRENPEIIYSVLLSMKLTIIHLD